MSERVTVIGGGLAGSEAAWQLAQRGHDVTLCEMRPVRTTPAHKTERLAELVCSNTFKSTELTNAHGLLKAEMRLLGSVILEAADEARDALSNYWRALEGTLDEEKVRRATDNALIGDAVTIERQMRERFHPEDRLMLWFDFNNHDSERVMQNMTQFMTRVAPRFS